MTGSGFVVLTNAHTGPHHHQPRGGSNTSFRQISGPPSATSTSVSAPADDGAEEIANNICTDETPSRPIPLQATNEAVTSAKMPKNQGALKVLFLSADTGGGHRASAESLAKQFLIHYPGSTYDLLDVWTEDGVYPYKTLVESYKHLSAHPQQWKMLYHLSNTRPWEVLMDWHSAFMCEAKIRARIASYNPDVIVSVHPAMQYVPMKSVRHLSRERGRHIPFFTVVTDLGSGHCTWFQKHPDKIYIASERIRRLTKRRGGTEDCKIVSTGLPIRHDFAVHSKAMGDRTTPSGQAYVQKMKLDLGLPGDKPMVLLMGGGEGVGSLSEIVEQVYRSLVSEGVDATICVVCGRNENLRLSLEQRDWDAVLEARPKFSKRRFFSRILWRRRRSRRLQESLDRAEAYQHDRPDLVNARATVDVIGLGFVTRMAEYMVAADVLVTKAGPGSIAEAASVGLPIMLTSFLPGQEAGNVDFVLDAGFGDYNGDPVEIAQELTIWLKDRKLLVAMSKSAQGSGHPTAAEDIVLDIGETTRAWMLLNNK
jgi:1,2-diacylglycerol 3-beta-galactosyltransferase